MVRKMINEEGLTDEQFKEFVKQKGVKYPDFKKKADAAKKKQVEGGK